MTYQSEKGEIRSCIDDPCYEEVQLYVDAFPTLVLTALVLTGQCVPEGVNGYALEH